MSIRIKLILFISGIIIIIDALSCMSFFFYSKKRYRVELRYFGETLVNLFSRDNEIRYALEYEQPLLFASPVRRIKEFDRENVVCYISISNDREKLFEDKATWLDIETNEIPGRNHQDDTSDTDYRVITVSGKRFYEYFTPIRERQVFSGEGLAEQILSEESVNRKNMPKGFVQVLLSTHRLDEKIRSVIIYSIMPVGIGIVFGGLGIMLLLTKYIVSPLQHLTHVTLEIAGGNLDRKVHASHNDEIGQLCDNFNQMTDALRNSHNHLTAEIADHKRAKEQLLKLSQAVEQSFTAIVITDVACAIEHVNPKFTEVTGYAREEALGNKLFDLLLFNMSDERHENIITMVLSGEIWRKELVNSRKDGEQFFAQVTISAVRGDDGYIINFIGVIEDITERKKFEEMLVVMAEHDPLTNLFNRRRFQVELEYWLGYSKRYNTGGALLFLDIDNFKYINDTLGHKVGDEILVEFAILLKERVRPNDIIARLGGDEFAVILPNTNVDHARSFAEQITQSAQKHFRVLNERGHNITTSLGIALFPDHSLEADALLACADMAMYGAKEAGKNQCCIFSLEQKQNIESRFLWDKRIRSALGKDDFEIYLQPIVDLRSNAVFGYEALLRMVGENGELIPPAEFLPYAERHGSILDIDRWVVRNAFRLFVRYNMQEKKAVLEINLSGKAITDSGMLSFIKEELSASQADARYITFEVTESAVVENIEYARYFMNDLCNQGFRFALDDFGIGFCSFTYLKHLPVDFLKIDGGFIRNLPDNPTDQCFVKAIADIGNGLEKKIIAEFVENKQTISLLKEIGVVYGQGHFFSKALSASEIFKTSS